MQNDVEACLELWERGNLQWIYTIIWQFSAKFKKGSHRSLACVRQEEAKPRSVSRGVTQMPVAPLWQVAEPLEEHVQACRALSAAHRHAKWTT